MRWRRRRPLFWQARYCPTAAGRLTQNLATWVTTLAACGLATANVLARFAATTGIDGMATEAQYLHRHPYTGAEPRGVGWTDLPGGVADADDTPGRSCVVVLMLAGRKPPTKPRPLE